MDNDNKPGLARSVGRVATLVVAGAMLILLALLLCWLIFLPEKRFLFGTIGTAVQGISDATGLNETLVKGLVTVLTIPLFAVLGTSYWEIFKKKLNPLLLYRDWRGWVVVGYLAAYWILLGTLRERAPMWCVVTPEGLRGFDIQRPDPVYHLPSHRCSPLEIAIIRGQRKVVEVSVTDPAHTQFFDPSTQPLQPLVWYSIGLDGQYHFFNGPGIDAANQILHPVTLQLVIELIERDRENKRRLASELPKEGTSAGTAPESSNPPAAGPAASPVGSPASQVSAGVGTLNTSFEATHWVGDFLKAYQGPSVEGMKPFFDSTVSPYFARSTAGWSAIAEDKQHYFDRFPHIEYTLDGDPREIRRSDNSRTIEFDVRYTNIRRDGAAMSGISQMVVDIGFIDDLWKITGIREKTASPNAPKSSPAASPGEEFSASITTVPASVMATRRISGSMPEYPAIARAARIQGTVVLQATISKTGEVERASVISGQPMLQFSAQNAVKTWRYQPYLLNGAAVEVSTLVNVTFKLTN